MYEYRQALMRMRQGDSEREIARSKLMGRSKAARFRELARAQGWLDPERPLPEDAEIAAVADGAVVGSAIVDRIAKNVGAGGSLTDEGIGDVLGFVAELASGVRRAKQPMAAGGAR